MPTIYTSLRARHRRKILPPNPPLPKSEIFAAPPVGEEIRSDKVMDWPGEQWTKASYYFLRLGEVTYWGPFWKAGYAGWLHFAGEHTSFAFMKYMEGALSSGYRVARKLAVRDHILPT